MVLPSGKVLVEIFFFRLLCKRLFADDKEAAAVAARVPNEFLRSKERKKDFDKSFSWLYCLIEGSKKRYLSSSQSRKRTRIYQMQECAVILIPSYSYNISSVFLRWSTKSKR